MPWRHYVPLKKDHSNHAEVIAVLKNASRAEDIIEAAYREVACNPDNTFQAFVRQFDKIIAEAFTPPSGLHCLTWTIRSSLSNPRPVWPHVDAG